MMRFLFFFWIYLVLERVQCMVSVKRVQCMVSGVANERGTSIECSSNADITFNFISPVQSASFTIAECDTSIARCLMLVKGLESTYDIVYSGRGGILKINHTGNDTYGTYECRETYYHTNYVTVDIIPSYNDSGTGNITCHESEEKTETGGILLLIANILGLIFISVTQTYVICSRILLGDPLKIGYSGLEDIRKSMRALRKENEQSKKNAINGCTHIVSEEDSRKTANVEKALTDIRKHLACLTKAFNTVQEAREVHVKRRSFGVRVRDFFKTNAKGDQTNKDGCQDIPLRQMETDSMLIPEEVLRKSPLKMIDKE